MKQLRLFSVALAVLLGMGCEPSVGVPETNRPPIADARVQGQKGQNAVIDYMGSPVEVTLDGSFSKDPDGKIKTYRWLSARRRPGTGAAAGSGAAGSRAGSGGAAAGSGAAGMAAADDDAGVDSELMSEQRWVPASEDQNWPDDVSKPVVTLGEGDFAFVLWVIDDGGQISAPSTLKVTVRTRLSPEVEACTATVNTSVSAACKACACNVSEECRTLVNASMCDAMCWGLLQCIAQKCPDYRTTMNTACLSANCGTVLGGATGATRTAPCFIPCTEQCRGN